MTDQLQSYVSPSKTPVSSPVLELHNCWVECKKKERENFDFKPWRDDLEDFLIMMMQSRGCMDVYNPSRLTNCNCMSRLNLSDHDKEKVVDYLISYAKMSRDDQRSLILEWKRYSKVFTLDIGERGSYGSKTFLLPGTTHLICQHAIAMIIGKKRSAWSSIKESNRGHGLKARPSNCRVKPEVEEDLHAYFLSLQELGAPRATRLVSNLSADKQKVNMELKDSDADLIKLPSCHRKRSLYRGFLLSQGWEAKFDNKSRQISLEQAGELVEEEATDKCPVSWPTFCQYWEQHFPKLVIQRPAEDLCDDCVIFANQHKYIKRFCKETAEEEDGSDVRVEVVETHDDQEKQMEQQPRAVGHQGSQTR